MAEKVVFCWSGGKDSAVAFHDISSDPRYDVVSLLTTVTREYDRISMHGVRRELLEAQADRLELPLRIVEIGARADMAEYDEAMARTLAAEREAGVTSAAFGDIFLEDLRQYRENKLAQAGMQGVFPIWKQDTAGLARRFIELGFHATITCVDTQRLGASFAGRDFDESFLADLPDSVDPCGENGEFHSYVKDGPIFREGIPVERGEVVIREGRFAYCDLIAASAEIVSR